jgi:hypothetical protein
MLAFDYTDDSPPFDYIARVEYKAQPEQPYELTELYALNPAVVHTYKNQVPLFCFPYPDNLRPRSNFSFCFTDSDKQFSYCFATTTSPSVAYCIVSRSFHPTFLSEVIARVAALHSGPDPAQCLAYVQFAADRRLAQTKYDCAFHAAADGDFRVENNNRMSPANEVGKLLRYMFSNFSVHHLLPLVCAMMFDMKIVILATTPEMLGLTAFGILGLIWPLAWPGTFIPILPRKLETVLEMPFGSIIGVHSTLCRKLVDDNFGAYFVINADTHDSCSVGTDDFPPEIVHEADAISEEIKELIRVFKPVFPAAEIQRKIKEFVLRALGAVYATDWKSPRALYEVFLQKRESTAEDIPAAISQTQFVDAMFREALEEQNYDILGALWPNYDLSESHGIDTLRTTPLTTTARFGLKAMAGAAKHRVDLSTSAFEVPIADQSTGTGESPISDSEWDRIINA